MNDWTLYKASCTECTRCDPDTHKCRRNPNRTESGVCPSFQLTFEAEARRYVAAYKYARKIGMQYDASRIIYNGMPRQVRVRIDEFMKG